MTMDEHNDPAKILRLQAEELKKQKKFEEAVFVETTIEEFEKNSGAENYWINSGISLRYMGKYAEALQCFDKELEVHMNNFEPHFEKGVTLFALGKHDDALECFFKAFEIMFSRTYGHSTLMDTLKSHKKLEEVVASSITDEQKMQQYYLYYYLAITLFELQRYDEAITNFPKATKLFSNDFEIFYDWAKCELMLDNVEKCLELLESAQKINSAVTKLLQIDNTFNKIRDNEKFRILCNKNSIV